MKLKTFTLFLLILGIAACQENKKSSPDGGEAAIVSINGETLYLTDLRNIVPTNLSVEDSIKAAQDYIQKWLNDQLLYSKAKKNITNQKEIDELVENYKKSLIINSYQENLFKEYFSRHVSDNEMKEYFDKNKEQFKLRDDIIKGLYLKIPRKSPQLNNFRKWYIQTGEAAIENIEKNTLQNVVNYEYFYDKWLNLSDLMGNIPYIVTNSEQFLRANKNIEVQDSSFVYLLNIKEYRLAGSEAPYEYAKGNLGQIFKEKKKEIFLKQIEKDLYDKALADDEIKFHEK